MRRLTALFATIGDGMFAGFDWLGRTALPRRVRAAHLRREAAANRDLAALLASRPALSAACRRLAALANEQDARAAAYVDHPDYRDEWRP